MFGEIVTVQLGHYANFVGAHWWNFQEASFVYDSASPTDINHDVLFREGQTPNGEFTYLPRAVVIDLKGSLNTLRQEGVLYTSKKLTEVPWNGPVTIKKTEPTQKNEYLKDLEKEEGQYLAGAGAEVDLEDDACQDSSTDEQDVTPVRDRVYNLEPSVDVWSDFLRVHFHPKSVFLIEDYTHKNEVERFDLYGLGQQLWSQDKTSESIEEKLRFFIEECDNMQGFQILVDGFNGFAGVASGLTTFLQDEYSKKSVLCVPTFPAAYSDDMPVVSGLHRLFSIAFALDGLSTHASLVTPLSLATTFAILQSPCRSFPFVHYNANLPYHTSALLAAALETATTPYRLKKDSLSLDRLTSLLSPAGLKIAAQSVSIPFPVQVGTLSRALTKLGYDSILQSLTPGYMVSGASSISQTVAYRGLNDVPLYNVGDLCSGDTPLRRCETQDEIFTSYVSESSPSNCSVVKSAVDACHTIPPFPNVFSQNISSSGHLTTQLRDPNEVVKKLPTLGAIHCSQHVGKVLQDLVQEVEKRKIHKFHRIGSSGIEMDEVNEMLARLKYLSQEYSNCFGS